VRYACGCGVSGSSAPGRARTGKGARPLRKGLLIVTLTGRPTARPRVRILAVVAILTVLAALAAISPARPAAAAGAPAYIGNGYVGTRVPADGAGYTETPVATETHVAGVYADKPDVEHGGIQRQGSVNLPGWTQLDVIVAGHRYAAADASDYRQVLDLRHGKVTTTATWSAGGRATRLVYDVALDLGQPPGP
jgi:hypothetical protein